MNLVFVDGALYSGDYDGMVKKWDVSNSGKRNLFKYPDFPV